MGEQMNDDGHRNGSERDLDPEFVVAAYCAGYFPMAESRTGPISWFSPDPRAIIPLDGFRIPRSLRQSMRKGMYEVRTDAACAEVIRACAEREETWISEEIIQVYARLHERGVVHSVESWQEGRLLGGLYGVSIGGAFFGESMFSRARDASKVALVSLVSRLRERGYLLLDTQFINNHVLQFGAREIPREQYLKLLARALTVETSFED
jgi:leucyl/phenylalanyl-tRNA---protein transferase